MSYKKIDIVIIGDENVEIGTHVTLYSILDNSSYDYHNIYYITKGYTNDAHKRLETSLSPFTDRYKLQIIEVDDANFSSHKGLHGNTFTYAKLIIADLIDCDKVLYIDIDVVVAMDIFEIDGYLDLLEDYSILANKERTLHTALEKQLYTTILDLKDRPYINAGIMLINLEHWRKNKMSEQFLKFADKYNQYLQAADQTIINGVLKEDEIGLIPDKFNYRVENLLPKNTYLNKIAVLHFYGRPKPWDLFAEIVHPHSAIFREVLKKTYFKKFNSVSHVNNKALKLFFRTYRSYIKTIFKIKV